ncbi:MAG TPA: hypothetical protein PKY12_01260 [Catalimonadaceae bacterium]|jgi:hypothetical protein|nr:hypothetical protein [Catalimonadaceae bacterium]
MASTAEIKDWIREIKAGKPISDASILVQKSGENQTRITLIDACCSPHFTVEKQAALIEKQDIEAHRNRINHKH